MRDIQLKKDDIYKIQAFSKYLCSERVQQPSRILYETKQPY